MKTVLLAVLWAFTLTPLPQLAMGSERYVPPARADVEDVINGIDLKEVEKLLQGPGAVGWIHGAVSDYRQFVFTFRSPDNFFKFVVLSIATRNPKLLKQLGTLNRHDLVRIKGKFSNNPSPQKHIKVKSIELIKQFDPGMPFPKYQHAAKLPDELKTKSSLIGKVHAVVAGGKIFVIEYKDAVIPLYVEETQHTENLYRNDKIRLHYTIQDFPQLPVHLELDTRVSQPIEVLDRVEDLHGQKGTLEGNLVLFPKSPQLKFNVFALQVIDADGVKRNFTLVNFNDINVFMAILDKLGNLWNDNAKSGIVNGRNKLINLNLKIRATGTFNVVDPNQANAQILLSSVNDVEMVTKK